ncbi:MAG TPA: PQQ-binding-like beta-propeller repeat protein, partial [Geminicoccaceae bacterium]|nr:PQQ-binding-like beta-propeller repeat protein [Geminicoccaceae bacterium]
MAKGTTTMRNSCWWVTTALALAFSQSACTSQGMRTQSEKPVAMTGAGGGWPVYGGDMSNTRYSASDQINAGNVQTLHLKWLFQTGVIGSFETTPIVEDGVMYITTPYNHLFAIDARTGKELWSYEHKLGTTIFCCGPNNRGVALAGDKVYMATLDAALVALNKKTGDVVWETEIADPEFGYSETVAPTVYGNKVILGISGAEYGIRGFISAYDKDTGKLIWRWHTIPEPNEVMPDGTRGWYGTYSNLADGINPLHRDIAAEKAAASKYPDAWKRGGGSNWMTNAIDPERGLLFAAIGNPSPDLYSEIRPGDNRWTESLVALDVNTGKLVWGYQYVPHDPWDFDAVSPPVLADVTGKDGKTLTVPAVILGGKTGWVYVHDRQTGKLIRRSDAMIPQENLFTQPTEQGIRMLPGANGGVEWSPGAFNPNTRLVYYDNLHQPMTYKVKKEPWQQGKLWLGGAFTAIPGEDQWGNLSAVNVDTGKIAWQAKSEDPMIGGTLTTGGNLVFAGEGDGSFNAYNATTGQKLWSFHA